MDSIELGADGARGNRRFFIVDERDRMVNAKVIGELQTVVASVEGDRLRFQMVAPGNERDHRLARVDAVEPDRHRLARNSTLSIEHLVRYCSS